MQYYKKNSVDSLGDLFFLWMGGEPDSHLELRNFIEASNLSLIMDVNDLDAVVSGKVFFPDIALRTIYAAIPLKFSTYRGDIVVSEKDFVELNEKAKKIPLARSLDISFAGLIKLKKLVNDEKKILIRKEKARIKMAKYRAKHPEYVKKENKKDYERRGGKNMTEERRRQLQEAKRASNIRYNAKHREELRQKRMSKTQQLKLENPELYSQMLRKQNQTLAHKEGKKRYKERHRDELNEKRRNNPKTKEYDRKYKAAKRFKEKTGSRIINLLYAIANSKQGR